MQNLTIRNVPSDLSQRLEEEKRTRGRSLNQTVLELLSEALGLGGRGRRRNGLAAFGGGWSDDEVAEFESATSFMEEVDEELWR